jgi:hypothetical protein
VSVSGRIDVMLSVGNLDGTPRMIMQAVSPVVYLDHNGINFVCRSSALSERFIEAIRGTGGTLALSWVGLREFAAVTDQRQRQRAECLLQAIWPQIFILEPEPYKVEARELAGWPVPYGDPEIGMVVFLREVLLRGGLHGLLDLMFTDGQILRGTSAVDKVAQRLLELRNDYAADAGFQRRVARADTSPPHRAQTRMRSVLRAILEPLVKDPSRHIPTNGAFDLLHAVVPVAYCDIVFLDGAWRHQAEQAQQKLTKADSEVKLAKACSPKRNGVGQFLGHLEALGLARGARLPVG